MAVPGTFDGSRYQDLRVLLPDPIKEYYQQRGVWDQIIRCRFYANSQSVTYTTTYGTTRHTWQCVSRLGRVGTWRIVDDSYDTLPA